MTNEASSVPVEGRDQIAVIEEQERLLRSMLGDEDEFLVDLVQAGMQAEEFRRSREGKVFLQDQLQAMRNAMAVLTDPQKPDGETAGAVYQLRVAYAAVQGIIGAITAADAAARKIDDITTN